MELPELGPPGLSEGTEDRSRLGHRARDDFADSLVGSIRRERGAAVGDELVQLEHGSRTSASADAPAAGLCAGGRPKSRCPGARSLQRTGERSPGRAALAGPCRSGYLAAL